MLITALAIFICSFAISWISVRITRNIARAHGWVAAIRGDRWHSQATPLFGGAGIAVALLVALALARGFIDEFRDATSANASLAVALIVGSIGAAVAGLCDDLLHFRPGKKLAAQCGCACAFLWICGGIEVTGSAPVDSVLCMLWIVTVMNAVNMLDNMDGVAGTAVTIGFGGVAFANWMVAPGSFVFCVAVIAMGVTAGFLAQNLPRARIFMGDCGSLLLGFLLATLVLIGMRPAEGATAHGVLVVSQGWTVTMVAAIGFAFVPLVDMAVVSLARIRRGQSPMTGGRDHTTHRLAGMGFSGNSIVAIVALVAATSATFAAIAVAGFIGLFAGCAILIIGYGVAVTSGLLMLVRADAKDSQISVADVPHRLAAFTPFAKLVIDVMLIATSLNIGYLIRWEYEIPPELANSLAWSLPIALACCVSVNALAGVYWSRWRATSATRWVELRRGVLSAALGALITVILVSALWSPDRLFSRLAMGMFAIGYPAIIVAIRIALNVGRG